MLLSADVLTHPAIIDMIKSINLALGKISSVRMLCIQLQSGKFFVVILPQQL